MSLIKSKLFKKSRTSSFFIYSSDKLTNIKHESDVFNGVLGSSSITIYVRQNIP